MLSGIRNRDIQLLKKKEAASDDQHYQELNKIIIDGWPEKCDLYVPEILKAILTISCRIAKRKTKN